MCVCECMCECECVCTCVCECECVCVCVCVSECVCNVNPCVHVLVPLSQGVWGVSQREEEEEAATRAQFAEENVSTLNSQFTILHDLFKVCVCVHVCVCVCVCVFVCAYIFVMSVYTYIYMYICTHVHCLQDKVVDFMHKLTAHSEQKLRYLCFRLDFNEFYSSSSNELRSTSFIRKMK